MYRHVDDILNAYPLALNGLGAEDAWYEKLWNYVAPTSPLIQTYNAVDVVTSDADTASSPTTSKLFKMPSQSTPSRASIISKPVVEIANSSSIYSRVSDLKDFGFITDGEKQNVLSLIKQNPAIADRELKRLEARTGFKGSSAKSSSFFDKFDSNLPEGYKLNQKLIPNLPNYMLYAVGGIFTIFTLRSLTRK